jgi:hypothetical protein
VRYDLTTDVGKVRLIVNDKDFEHLMFSDDEIEAFVTMNSCILNAAAMALDTIASNEVLVQKRIKLLDLSTDGPSEAKALREHAAELRKQALEEEGETIFDVPDWAENPVDDFSLREKIAKDAIRGIP